MQRTTTFVPSCQLKFVMALLSSSCPLAAVNTLSLELSLLRPHACGRVKGILNRTFSSRN